MSERVSGIHPLVPGWTCFEIRPQPGMLKDISASLLVPQGEIRFEARKSGRCWKVRVSVPDGTVARPDFSALGLADVPDALPAGFWEFKMEIKKNVNLEEPAYV
jgi:hypothetical protein